MILDKDESIIQLIERLGLEERGWTIVDHWDGDLCAIGIADSSSPRNLVYVSTYNKAAGYYDYQCERPRADSADESDYDIVAEGEDAPFDELFCATRKHLGVCDD